MQITRSPQRGQSGSSGELWDEHSVVTPKGMGELWGGRCSPIPPCPGSAGGKGLGADKEEQGVASQLLPGHMQEGLGYQRGQQELPLGPDGKGSGAPAGPFLRGELGSCRSTCAGRHGFPGLLQPGGLGDTAGPAPCTHPQRAIVVL